MTAALSSSRSLAIAGAICGLGSAALFGISAPLAKLLLPRVDAWVLAGLLYLGAGVGLVALRVAQRAAGNRPDASTRLTRGDLPLLLAIAFIGGGLGPVLLLVGLGRLSGVAGALLLNLEAVFTAVLAVTVFRERVTRLELSGVVVVVVGAVLLSATGGSFDGGLFGIAAVVAACLAWGIDNNLTARVSGRNAVELVRFKALTAGTGNLVLAMAAGHPLPGLGIAVLSLGVGFISYGVSIVLDVYALRYIGAARESGYFATAPFAGAAAAVPLLGERMAATEIVAGVVMAAGIALLITGRPSETPRTA